MHRTVMILYNQHAALLETNALLQLQSHFINYVISKMTYYVSKD